MPLKILCSRTTSYRWPRTTGGPRNTGQGRPFPKANDAFPLIFISDSPHLSESLKNFPTFTFSPKNFAFYPQKFLMTFFKIIVYLDLGLLLFIVHAKSLFFFFLFLFL